MDGKIDTMTKPSAANPKSRWDSNSAVRAATIAMLCCYLIGWIFPEQLWGVHFLAYLNPVVSFAVIGIAFYLSLFFNVPKALTTWLQSVNEKRPALGPAIVISTLAGTCFYLFPIHIDVFGDAPRFRANLLYAYENGSAVDHLAVFGDFHVLNPKIGERTVLNGVMVLANQLGIGPELTFRYVDAIMGGVYVFASLLFAHVYFKRSGGKLIAILILCSGPFLMSFFGRFEVYAPSYLFISLFCMQLLLYLREPASRRMIALILCYFLAAKFHFSSLLLLAPILLFAIIFYFTQPAVLWKKVNWRKVLFWILAPAFLALLVLYFLVFKDHADPRFLTSEVDVMDRLFLPLFSPESPLDRYNLLGFNHLLDYANLLFFWSGSALLVLLLSLTKWRKRIRWNRLEIMATGVTFIFFAGFFFMLNPLLGMPVDCDLMALPAPVFLFFVIAILKDESLDTVKMQLLFPIIGIALVAGLIVPIHHNKNRLSHRFEDIGKHTFKTYWIYAAKQIEHGLALEENKEAYQRRLNEALVELEPYAAEKDIEYASLLHLLGAFYRKSGKPGKAVEFHLKALRKDASNRIHILGLTEAYFLMGDYENAYQTAKIMIREKYPDEARALRTGIHCAIYTKSYKDALQLSRQYVKIHPDDQQIQEARRRLEHPETQQSAAELFESR